MNQMTSHGQIYFPLTMISCLCPRMKSFASVELTFAFTYFLVYYGKYMKITPTLRKPPITFDPDPNTPQIFTMLH